MVGGRVDGGDEPNARAANQGSDGGLGIERWRDIKDMRRGTFVYKKLIYLLSEGKCRQALGE